MTAGQAHDQAQREFRAALERLSTGAAHPADADLIDRACAVANGGSCASSPADAETAGGVDAIAEDALSKPSQTRNWILLPLGAVLALLLSASLLLVHRNWRRPPEETAC